MANKSLTDLTARTATADSDLLHINSGGTDYKQTKNNFCSDLTKYNAFSSASSILSQVDALPEASSYLGKVSSATIATTLVPENGSYYVEVIVSSTTYARIKLVRFTNGEIYYRQKVNGTWESSWTKEPTRSEITSINNSLTQCLTKTAGYIDSGNLNNYVTNGLYLMADKNYITNCPSSWSALLVIGIGGSYGCHQLTFAFGHGIYYRSLTGSPLAWTTWKHLAGE